MGDAIRENSDYYQDAIEESLMDYQEETHLEIQEIHLEAGLPQETENKSLFKHTQDAQIFQVTPAKIMEYILRTATKMTVFIENSQHPFILYSESHCSIVAREYLDKHFLN
ncbi:hypothetical protein O181_042665 [Austropuccinia psidii MF-1]|uniref:Uncharacterized protein n=1 Tax=Austropuccinia psidii MF-1 TaxID=1389203 RepID=A0A9Q3DH21_9BASI|nr:hypothetical protein [Austropuccinia psidii MF-1]